ncbi:AP-1-like transcription factor [Sporothrix epigloea]|uniref:AP-1-like transcription factor n=1 Tax=Sporothrix epigloea TaxID=1892477 RepID=A0ABP0DUH7_9PEZI
MDYTHSYFAGTQPYQQQFNGISPNTPMHPDFATPQDYNTTSLPGDYRNFSNEHFPAFGGHGVPYATPQPIFVGPPTPPGQQNQHLAGQSAWPPAAAAAAAPPVTPTPATPSAAASIMYIDRPNALDSLSSTTNPDPSMVEDGPPSLDQSRRGSSKSDDDDMPPAQSRRKAQNRAAQRAFRERKERHVKELEARLASLEATQNETMSENERLKRDLQKISTENEILRATSSLHAAASASGASPRSDGGSSLTAGPMTYNPTTFYSDLLANHPVKTPSHRIIASDSGERLLGAGATWDLIVGHESFKRGLVDVADISNLLKSQAKCDGQGPVFEERAILEAIAQSVRSGSDSLM